MVARIIGGIVIAVLAIWLLGRIWNLIGSLIVVALLVGAILVVYNLVFAKRQTY